MPIIEFDNVTFTYDGKRNALDGLSLRIEQGEFACILGGNGSGKSTLAKHINALLTPDGGTVNVLGRDTKDPASTYFIRSNAGMIFQNPDDQIVASVIEDDVAFGPENLGVPTEELGARVAEALEQVGLQGFENVETTALSGGQKQRVAIAGVLAMRPEILVLDEASAMLDPRGRADLIKLCRKLNADGLTVVLITHFMEEAAEADHVVVLRDGRVALEGTPEETLTRADELADLDLDIPFPVRMSRALQGRGADVPACLTTRKLVAELEGKPGLHPSSSEGQSEHPAPAPAAVEKASEPVIGFSGVSFTYLRKKPEERPDMPEHTWGNAPDDPWALKDVSFDVREGEFLGIAGHTGSGKSTLIQLANGLLKPTEGVVCAQGRDLSDKRAAAEARRSVGVAFQYPERQLFAATVYDDVAFGPRNMGLDAAAVEARVRDALEQVHLSYDDLRDSSPFALSGGQQRRVAFAGVLAMQPTTLILDEPAAGLDPQARHQLIELVEEFHAKDGLTVVMVSHSMDDLARLCDRIMILNQGRLLALGTPAEVYADEQALKNVGLGVPSTTHLAHVLGIPAPADHVFGLDELAAEIASRAAQTGIAG